MERFEERQAGAGRSREHAEACGYEVRGLRYDFLCRRARAHVDLVDNQDSIKLIESFYDSGKPVAAVKKKKKKKKKKKRATRRGYFIV